VNDTFDNRAHTEAFAHLQELIATGRRYERFAHENPSESAAQITELNAPGLQENAWDLLWVPHILRTRIARVSSIIVLNLSRMPGDPKHDPALMDVIMPAAILAACVVADAYGVAPEIPARPLQGHLEVLARVLHRLTVQQPEELEAIGRRARATIAPAVHPPIVACLPSRVCDRLIGLAHIMARLGDPLHQKVVAMVIFTLGAVAAEIFESLNFDSLTSGPSLPT